jgi:hypothetical protein
MQSTNSLKNELAARIETPPLFCSVVVRSDSSLGSTGSTMLFVVACLRFKVVLVVVVVPFRFVDVVVEVRFVVFSPIAALLLFSRSEFDHDDDAFTDDDNEVDGDGDANPTKLIQFQLSFSLPLSRLD